VLHYVVDHTPAIFHKTATEAISETVANYIGQLVEGCPGACLKRATVIESGKILDERIKRFQNRT
jgi:N5-(carboxyethyl)ornithine synthase